MAATGRRLLCGGGEGRRFSPLCVTGAATHHRQHRIVGDGLYAFVLDSAKRRDLERDGRFALHAHQDRAAPTEFMLRGHAHVIEPGALRDTVAAEWYFSVDDGYRLFEFSIEAALLGERSGPDDWPPRYARWNAGER
jgi:hypothetical protein